ncbi:hypothetical protein PVAND_017426 [Polypedilum vanderplanki]|uniref:Aminopeptidase N n=1 Tax=Polypedilum vanderplanki TaxID=319348 RepID=A0A9J6BJ04_POLVA|nr:hypothetical protein PVAND_017426 [Polypedilum vanderplanki]
MVKWKENKVLLLILVIISAVYCAPFDEDVHDNQLNDVEVFVIDNNQHVLKNDANLDAVEGEVWFLPKTSKPEYYRIHLDVRNIHTGNLNFNGEVTIHTEILQSNQNFIVLHSKFQQINELHARNLDTNDEITIIDHQFSPAYETVVIYFANQIEIGTKIALTLNYSSQLVTSAVIGFYQTYYDVDGVRKYVGATQFEEMGARYAFPCYDEPEYKAVFELSFIHDESVNVFSNTKETIQSNGDGTTTTAFKPTPLMSSYLNAFIVSEFKTLSNEELKNENETLVRIIAREDWLDRAQYGLISSIYALKALEEYVGFKYELEKMDSAMIPRKLNAMENWGILFYVNTALIYENDINTKSRYTQVFSGTRLIAHEVTHQFFGNAVTCKWWKYIWLNEGFAQLFQYTITDIVHPDWRMQDYFNIFAMQDRAFNHDATENTRAMTTDATTSEEVGLLFDIVAYDKAASVIRMFQYAVGEDIFRQTIKYYITTHNHGSVVSQDLIDAFTTIMQQNNFTDFNFERAFRTWELQKGFPLVHVSYINNTSTLRVTHQRFYDNASLGVNDESSWYIPLNFATSSNPDFEDTSISDYFMDYAESLNIAILPPAQNEDFWFIFNKQQRGYYRVNYDEVNWKAISKVLYNPETFNQIHVMNRVQLIDDSFALADAGFFDDYEIPFSILRYLHLEDDYFPWYVANKYINKLYDVFGLKNDDLNTFVQKLSSKFYKKFVVPGDSVMAYDSMIERYGRLLAYNLACTAGNEDCLLDVHLMLAYHSEPEYGIIVPRGYENFICLGLREDKQERYFYGIWNRMKNETDSGIRADLIAALACTGHEPFLMELLESSVNSQFDYTIEERQLILKSIFKSRIAFPAVIEFIKKFKSQIMSAYEQDFVTILTTIANGVKEINEQIEFNNFVLLSEDLKDEEVLILQRITAGNINRQKSWPYNRQMELLQQINIDYEFDLNDYYQIILPGSSRPTSYKVNIDINYFNLGHRNITGNVEMEIDFTQYTNKIYFHSFNQTISQLHAFDKVDGREIQIIDFRYFPQYETVMILFNRTFMPGNQINLEFFYEGWMQTDPIGLYSTRYVLNDENGPRNRYIVAAKFEPFRTRYAFPCYDEPRYKADFTFSIVHHTAYVARSNMMEKPPVRAGLFMLSAFETTQIMSPYHVTVIVSDYQNRNNSEYKTENEIIQRVLVPSDNYENVDHVLNYSIDALKALIDFTGFYYETGKLDSVMIPSEEGTSGNVGLNFYPPSILYINPETSSHHDLLKAYLLISNFVSLQFFGGAVTVDWWDQIWINEGFAHLFQHIVLDKVHPEMRIHDFMTILSMHDVAFQKDNRNTTHEMWYQADTTEEIAATFDHVSIQKAALILRMLMYHIGEDVFRATMKDYLFKFNHQSVDTFDVREIFADNLKVAGKYDYNFEYSFSLHEEQLGFPLVSVTFNGSHFELQQWRFYSNQEEALIDCYVPDGEQYNPSCNHTWYIPFNFATEENPDFDDLSSEIFFDNEKGTTSQEDDYEIPAQDVPVDGHEIGKWHIFNKQSIGYYRVNYDDINWNALINALSSPKYKIIHPMNRVQLIDDSFALAEAKYFDYERAFNIMKYLVYENDYFPWYTANRQLKILYDAFGEKNDELNTFIRTLSKKFYQKYQLSSSATIPKEILPDRFGRELAINLACTSGNEQCLTDTAILVHNFAINGQSIPAGLENILCFGLRGSGKSEEFNKILEILRVKTDLNVRMKFINALGCTDDSELLMSFLEESIFTGNVDYNYTTAQRRAMFTSSLQSKIALSTIIEFLNENEAAARAFYSYNLNSIMTFVANSLKTEKEQEEFTNYIETLADLSTTQKRNLNAIVSENLNKQIAGKVKRFMEIIKEIELEEPKEEEETTTTVQLTTTSTPRQTTAQSTTISDSTTVSTTTLGASSIGIKSLTLILCIFIVILLKN